MRSGYIIGAGPSIQDLLPLETLTSNGTVIGINAAYANHSKLDYLVFLDPWFWGEKKSVLGELKSTKILTVGNACIREKWIQNLSPLKPGDFCVPKSLEDKFKKTDNTAGLALQVACALRLNPIYLIGIDLVQEDLKNGYPHAHSEYPVRRLGHTRAERNKVFIDCVMYWVDVLNQQGVRVFSCSKRSSLNMKIPYFDLRGQKK